MSKVCFQLVREDGGGPVDLKRVDDEMCCEFGVEPSEHDWYAGWYDRVGPMLAAGRPLDKVVKQVEYDAEVTKTASLGLLSAVKFLRNGFKVVSWNEGAAKWLGTPPNFCNFCGDPILDEFYDAPLPRTSTWGILCRTCFGGRKTGTGLGQRYVLANEEWVKVQ